MESSIKIAIFLFSFLTYNNVAKHSCHPLFVVLIRLSSSSSFSFLTFFCATVLEKSLHSKDDIPVRFRFFRHKSCGKKQIIDIAAAINSRSRVITAATETCEDRSVTMPMEFTEKKNYREHELRKDKEKWMVISFSRNKTIVTRSNDGERWLDVSYICIYIYVYAYVCVYR